MPSNSPYITIPDPGATLPSIAAAVAALKQAVNILIVNSQGVAKSSNLQGASIFALQETIKNIPTGPPGLPGPEGPIGPVGPPSFPDAPIDGGYYGRVNATWGAVLPLTGGVITGPTYFQGSNLIGLYATSGNQRGILGGTGTSPGAVSWRWQLQLGDQIPESGSNSGSNFTLISIDDTGAVLSRPLNVNRATGVLTLSVAPTIALSPINATDDTAAATAGVPVGGVYRNGSVLMIRVT
jgi:hypothetical protein